MKRVLLAYAISGFVSLTYQVVWFRIFSDRFGSTNLTFALVVANFIGGLAVGSVASRRVTRLASRLPGLGEGLRVYGAFEVAVALAVGITFATARLPADLWGHFPYVLQAGIWERSLGYRLFQAGAAAACVFVPCFFMGVTYPLLCDRFQSHPAGARFPAALYAWNTLGACTGVLACQFVFLPRLGHDVTLAWMALANGLLGAGFLFIGGLFRAAPGGPSPQPAPFAPTALAADRTATASERRARPVVLLVLVVVGGFLAGALEGDLFKRITFVIELDPGATMSFISFWAILAIFLASATVRRLPRLPLPAIKVAFALAAVYCVATWLSVDGIRDFVESTVTPIPVAVAPNLEGMRNLDFPSHLAQLWVFTGILVFPPYFAVSLLLPAVCNELQRRGGHLGLAYGLNTVAFCTGFLAFMLFVPALGNVFQAFKLFDVLFAIGALWLFVLRESRPIGAWRPLVLLAAVVAAVVWAPADFDRSFFRKGSLPAVYPVHDVRSDGATTTFVVDAPGGPRLFFGRLQMSATNLRARTYMRLMAHFPLLLHPHPEKALLICLGVGNTGSAIARHESIRQIDVVDLNDEVIRTLPEFARTSGNLDHDPRVRFIHDDGRSFLAKTDQRYDLITSEPPPPLAAGVYRLYSTDYYRDARAHLTENGFMSQWLPLFLMTPEAVSMAVSSFLAVFPHALLFTGYGTDFVLVGSPSPIDPSLLPRRFAASDDVRAELAGFNIDDPASLLARVVQDDAALRRNYGDAPHIRDQRNDLEDLFLDPRSRPVVVYEPDDVIAWLHARLDGSDPELARRTVALLTHLGRLQYHVQGYPYETLATIDPDTKTKIALADVDWMAAARLAQENVAALRAGRSDLAIGVMQRFLALSDEQPSVWLQLARLHLERREYEDAADALEHFVRLEPDAYLGYQLLGTAYRQAGRPAEALAPFARAARLNERAWGPLEGMAWIHATYPEPPLRDGDRALALALQADRLAAGRDPAVRETLAAAYAAAGRQKLAVEAARAALDALPPARYGDRSRLERELSLYQEGRELVVPPN